MLNRIFRYMAWHSFPFAPTYTMLAYLNNKVLHGRTRVYIGYDNDSCVYLIRVGDAL